MILLILLFIFPGDNLQCPPLDRPFKSKVLQHVPENVTSNPFDKTAVGMVNEPLYQHILILKVIHLSFCYNLLQLCIEISLIIQQWETTMGKKRNKRTITFFDKHT